MKSVLFIMFPIRSHIIGVSRIATSFIEKGYRVSFVGNFPNDIAEFLRNHEFDYIHTETQPYGLDYFKSLRLYLDAGMTKEDLLRNLLTDADFFMRTSFYESLIPETEPQAVIMDSFIASDFIALAPTIMNKGIRFLFVDTFGSLLGSPRVCDSVLLRSTIVRMLSELRYELNEFFLAIILLGNSPRLKTLRRAKQLALTKYPIRSRHPFGIQVCNIPELVLSHKEFESIDTTENPDRHYIGFLPFIRRNDTMLRHEVDELKKLLLREKIIYIAFGTTNDTNREKIIHIIRKIHFVASRLPKHTFIFGNINVDLRQENYPVLDNLFYFGNLPQTFVLQTASLFICHGGFNSIKESICSKVPMVVIPLNEHYDQPSNSLNITRKRLGYTISWKDSPSRYLEVINEALTCAICKEQLEYFAGLDNKTNLKGTADAVLSKGCYI